MTYMTNKERANPSWHLAVCIGCGCDDMHACLGGCSWLRVDYVAHKGVCSQCGHETARWDAGQRHMSARISDNMIVIGHVLRAAWQESVKDATAAGYVAGMADMLHWLGELDEQQRAEMFQQLGSHAEVPGVPRWVSEN